MYFVGEKEMPKPKIKDVKGNEIRIQASQDRRFIDLYLGPEKTRKIRHSKPVKFSWWTAHRLYTKTEAQKLLKRLQQVVPKMK